MKQNITIGAAILFFITTLALLIVVVGLNKRLTETETSIHMIESRLVQEDQEEANQDLLERVLEFIANYEEIGD